MNNIGGDRTGVRGTLRRPRRSFPLACVLAGLLFTGLPAAASATTVEMRGEWELALNSNGVSGKGKALITEEANGKGEFASHSLKFETGASGAFSGTLEGAKASVTVTSEGGGGFPPASFTSTEMTVEASAVPPSMSGSGTLTFGSSQMPATLTATRIKTYQQVL